VHIPYDRILETITEKTAMEREQLEQRIEAKLKQLSGLISREGAAHIVANELGVKLVDQVSGKLKIGNILGGMRDVETEGKVLRVFETRTFQSERGGGQVASFVIGDESGSVRVVLWNDQAVRIKELAPGMAARIVGGYTRDRNEQVEVHLNDRSKLIINPEGAQVDARPLYERKKIRDLTEHDQQAEILATIYQVYEPRFFETCPQCGRRVRQQDAGFQCETHGAVQPEYSYVINLFLDDGSGTMRLVCFREQALRILGKAHEEFLSYRTAPESFDQVKNDLVGQIVKVVGRITRNELFDRLEMVAQLVYPNPDPKEELERLERMQ